MSFDINGSMRSNGGVIDVIIANRRPATRCKSGSSLSSRSSKISDLGSAVSPEEAHRKGMM